MIERDYPGQEDLRALIPNANNLIISKLYFGRIFETDTFNGAQKNRQLLCDLIADTDKMLFKNSSESELLLHKWGCWNHLRNVWIGSNRTHLSRKSSDFLERD